jgi:hypothetical protein
MMFEVENSFKKSILFLVLTEPWNSLQRWHIYFFEKNLPYKKGFSNKNYILQHFSLYRAFDRWRGLEIWHTRIERGILNLLSNYTFYYYISKFSDCFLPLWHKQFWISAYTVSLITTLTLTSFSTSTSALIFNFDFDSDCNYGTDFDLDLDNNFTFDYYFNFEIDSPLTLTLT